MLVETEEIITRHFPGAFKKMSEWKRLYPYAYSCYNSCPFQFFCKYIFPHKVVTTHVLVVGKRCHAMKDIYYKRIKIETLSRMLEANESYEFISAYIMRHFLKAIHDDDERAVMQGFSNLEAKRLIGIKEAIGFDEKTLRKFYLPAFTEVTLKAGMFGGRLDTIFRCDDEEYMPLDWKDGQSVPKQYKGETMLYDSIKTQMHIYGILIDDLGMEDTINGSTWLVKASKYAVVYPRHELAVVKDFESFIKTTIRENIPEMLENINDRYFPMQIGEFTCGFGAGSYMPCECLDQVCKKLFVRDLGFTVADGSVISGIEV